MLQPGNDRIDYGDMLKPPEGFQLDNAIATSYSLDLEMLILIPVALYFSGSLDLDIKKDVFKILDAIRRASDTVRVFCQKGQIKVPDNQHRLYSFIEPCIAQVPPTPRSSFHPKVWVIRYKNSEGDIRYRVIVLSRNLTFDRSADVAFQLDGTCNRERKNNFSSNKPLLDFITYLSGYGAAPWFKTFLADLGKTDFRPSLGEFDSFTFLPGGFKGYEKNILFDNQVYDELLIISPFLTKEGLELARKSSHTKPKLFSKEFELKRLNQDILKQFSVYHLATAFVEGEEKLETETAENSTIQLQDLHAKVYSFKSGWDAYLLLGSANCSQRAMLRNVEFMIQLKGKNSKIGPIALCDELVDEEPKIFQSYIPDTLLSPQENLLLEQERELQALKVEIVNATLTATATKQADANYSVAFDFDLTSTTLRANVEIVAYLLNAVGQEQVLHPGCRNAWTIRNIAEADLSCFLIISLQVKGSGVAVKFAMKILIANLPPSRSTRIFRDIISNTANFFHYLRFLLAENQWKEEPGFQELDGKFERGNGPNNFFNPEEPIYENMLKAVSREPEKLLEIKKVMEKLYEEEDKAQPIIPEDFKTLWHVFEQAQQLKA